MVTVEALLDVARVRVNPRDDKVSVHLLCSCEHDEVEVGTELLEEFVDMRSHAQLLVVREVSRLFEVHECLVQVQHNRILPHLVVIDWLALLGSISLLLIRLLLQSILTQRGRVLHGALLAVEQLIL